MVSAKDIMKWLQQAPMPGYDAVCFHAQQCIEKYLNAQICTTVREAIRAELGLPAVL